MNPSNERHATERGWGLSPDAMGWFGYAVAGLMLSGVFAILIVLGRTPGIAPTLGDAEFFRRSLVVHVNLALVVWFCAFIVGMTHTLGRRSSSAGATRWLGHATFGVGMILMMGGAWVPGSRAILANYVPGVSNGLFMAGLVLIGAGLLLGLVQAPLAHALRVQPREQEGPPASSWVRLPSDAGIASAAAGIALLLALTTFALSVAAASRLGGSESAFTLSVWGGGHVLQTANVAAMCAVWLTLLGRVVGDLVLSRRQALVLFAWLLVPAVLSPLVVAIFGVTSPIYHTWFVRMMQFGLFPPVLCVLALSAARLFRWHRAAERCPSWSSDPFVIGWLCSVVLTLTGFVLGAMIRGSSTMIPAHYHAAIGGVTVSFMALTWLWWRETLGERASGSAVVWFGRQPLLFTVGQLAFALGFGLAGASGMARKVYADEQVTRSMSEVIGLLMMAGGGLVAVAGGLVFLGLFGRLLVRRLRAATHVEEETWKRVPTTERIPSSG